MSLRTKLILSMLLTSLLSVLVVGSIAYLKLANKFDDALRQDAFQRFQTSVVAYIREYGSWTAAMRAEPFPRFVERFEAARGRPALAIGLDGTATPIASPRPVAPPPDTLWPVDDARPPGQPIAPEPSRQPFRFVLFDTDHRAMLPTPPYLTGDKVGEDDIRTGLPIRINGQVIAYAAPHGVATLSAQDISYLNAMREALAYGMLVALTLALLLGIGLGNRLSRSLRQLTQAIRQLGQGLLHQRVLTDRGDEIGILARAFNRMSEELSASHQALQDSNRQIQAQADQMKELSIRDALTKLYNRRHFDEHAAQLYAQARRYQHPLTVMIGDIDFFKRINDHFSHATGDEVLRRIGELLATELRASDLVARYGGEEFVIAFPETSLPVAIRLCERLRTRIEGFAWAQIHPELRVTMSMGLYDDMGAGDIHAMLEAADAQLYQAKAGGRNRVCYA